MDCDSVIDNKIIHFLMFVPDINFLKENNPHLMNFIDTRSVEFPQPMPQLIGIPYNPEKYCASEDFMNKLESLVKSINKPEITKEFENVFILNIRKRTSLILEGIQEMRTDAFTMFMNKTVDNSSNFNEFESIRVKVSETHFLIMNCNNIDDIKNHFIKVKEMNLNAKNILVKMQLSFGSPQHTLTRDLSDMTPSAHPFEHLSSLHKMPPLMTRG